MAEFSHQSSIALVSAAISLGLIPVASGQEVPQAPPKIQQISVPAVPKLPAPSGVETLSSRPLTANEASAIALAHQTSVQIASSNADAARARIGQAKSALNPSLSTSTGYSQVHSNGSTPGTTSSGFSSTATVSQLIFDFNITRDIVRQTQALANASRLVLTQSQSDSVFSTKISFYAYYQSEQLVEVGAANLKDREAQFALAEAKYKSGAGAPSDVNIAQTNLDAAVLLLTQQQAASLTARVALALSMGINTLTPISIAESGESIRSQELPMLLELANLQRPEVLQAKEIVRAATFGVSIANRGTTPSISLSLGWNGQGTSGFSDSSRTSTGLFISWSPFDGGLARAKKSEAKYNKATAKQQVEQLIQSVQADVISVYIALTTATQAVTISSAQVTNAQESVRLAEGRYKAGLATFLEVTDAETALTQAKVNHVNAQSSLQQSRASLEHAIGSPIAELLKTI